MNIKVEIDDEDDQILAIYVSLGEGEIQRTVEIETDLCLVDEDSQGRPLGVEWLSTDDADLALGIAKVAARYPSEAGLRDALLCAIGKVAV